MLLNQCVISGRLGNDPELKYLATATPVVNFPFAVDGFKKEDPTSWFDVSLFGKTAEWVAENVHKGDEVILSGSVRVREFETKDGGKGRSVNFNAKELQLVPRRERQPEYAL